MKDLALVSVVRYLKAIDCIRVRPRFRRHVDIDNVVAIQIFGTNQLIDAWVATTGVQYLEKRDGDFIDRALEGVAGPFKVKIVVGKALDDVGEVTVRAVCVISIIDKS